MEPIETKRKPVVCLIGSERNTQAIIGMTRRALIHAGQTEQADRYWNSIQHVGPHELLKITLNYVEVE